MALADLIATPSFHADAACVEHPEVSWFPTRHQSNKPAVTICRTCLVQPECLQWALDQDDDLHGVWGGTSLQARQKLKAHGVSR